jgi:predicted transposase/invertase (TIGR01784 family)
MILKDLLDPKNDAVFKLFFSRAKNKSLLISFLESVLNPIFSIIDIEILNSEMPLESIDEKMSILDLVVTLSNKTQIDIEMQMAPTSNFKKRLLYYWAKLHSSQLKSGEDYQNLAPTYTIAILNYNEFKNTSKPHSIYELSERDSRELYLPDIKFHFLELKKLPDWTNKPNHSYNVLEYWMHFFASGKDISEDLSMSNETMKKAVDALKELSEDKEARSIALMREKARINGMLIRQGDLEEGEKIGRQKVISKMMAKGMSAQDIAELLDLSIEEVTEINTNED